MTQFNGGNKFTGFTRGLLQTNRNMTRWGVGGAFGLVALNRAQRSFDSMRYGSLTGTVLNAGLSTAAGFAAYSMFKQNSAHRTAAMGWMRTKVSQGSSWAMQQPGVGPKLGRALNTINRFL